MSEAARTGPEVTLIDQSSGLGRARSALPQVLIPLIAAVIFVLDVFTPAEVPIGVLYTILVLIASRFYEARGISTVAAVCTILVFVADPLTRLILSAPGSPTVQLINDFLCIATIGLTCFLIVQGQAASAALRRSEEEWKEIFEHTPTMYFMVNPAGTVMSVNHFGAAQLGYTVDELTGQSVLKVFPEPDRELARRNVAVCLENLGQSHTWELRKIRNDGSVLWVRENAKAVRRSRNDLIVLIACEDITERKRGEQRLAAQYAATRVLAESDTIAAAVPQLLQTIGEALEWEWGGLWCADCEGGRLRCVDIWRTLSVSTAEFDAVSREMTFSPGQGRPGQVWQSAEPVWMHDVTKALSFLRSSAAARAGLHGAVAFPILLGGEAMGVVEFFSRASRERDEEQLATLSAIGSQIGQFIKRKRAEERLQESERRFRALIENGSDVVLLVDAQNTVLYSSPSLTRVLGYEREELIGRTLFDLVHPDQVQEAMGGLAGLVEQSHKLLKGREYLLRHKDGSWRWLEAVAANLLDEPGVHAVVMNLRDVTERKQAEEALRESEQRFRDYAETASDWSWETGPDHRFTQFAPSLTAHGLDLRRMIGARRWEIAADRDEEPDKWRIHRAVLEARQPFRGLTYRVTGEDGSVIHISVSGKPVFDNKGQFLGYRGVSSDITAWVRADEAERALQDARAELAHIARVTTLGELTASIGHEINQPLAAVVTDASAGLRWLNG
ncbi:MAG: PAS domain S-box protein, partial [Acetobacteraceae bacterium]|nr:PAS domain S-box protein [Acetobacteraceae bacterium]